MNDSSDRSIPESHSPGQGLVAGKTLVLGLDYKVAGLLCYLPICGVNIIVSILMLASEPRANKFLRFHALQSLFLCGSFLVLGLGVGFFSMMLSLIPLIRYLVGLINFLWLLVTIGFVWLCVSAMLNAYRGKMTRLAVVGDMAERCL